VFINSKLISGSDIGSTETKTNRHLNAVYYGESEWGIIWIMWRNGEPINGIRSYNLTKVARMFKIA
jgi:hypothetical protein